MSQLAKNNKDCHEFYKNLYIICCLEVLAPKAHRFHLAWPQNIRTKKTTFLLHF